jgi:hypothetical protein
VLDPWNIIHILGFITQCLLPIFIMIMAVLSIFQAWICVGVGIGKFLKDVGVRNIFNAKLHGLRACLCLAGCLFRCITVVVCVLFGVKSAHVETGLE